VFRAHAERCHVRGGTGLVDHMCWTTSGEVRRGRTTSGQVRRGKTTSGQVRVSIMFPSPRLTNCMI